MTRIRLGAMGDEGRGKTRQNREEQENGTRQGEERYRGKRRGRGEAKMGTERQRKRSSDDSRGSRGEVFDAMFFSSFTTNDPSLDRAQL